MTETTHNLACLSRPRLLIRAARAGLAHYDRGRDLARILRDRVPSSAHATLDALLEHEARIEERRTAADATYDIGRHIEILIALMAEARLVLPPAGSE